MIMDLTEDVRICQHCNKEVNRSDMLFTRDCHGIAFQLVCYECYNKLMKTGYDGVYYDEWDEQIEPE